MDIKPGEVESVKIIGNLHGNDVKMVKTHGGFHVAVGKKKKNGNKTEALAAGSHQAIVAHQIAKEFGTDYQPAIMKSEADRLEDVMNKSELLSSEALAKGIELFTLEKNNHYDFVVYKRGMTLGKYQAELEGNTLKLTKYEFNTAPDMDIAKAVARMIEDKADELGVTEIEKGWL